MLLFGLVQKEKAGTSNHITRQWTNLKARGQREGKKMQHVFFFLLHCDLINSQAFFHQRY